jgi:hypothetical protein
MSDPSWNVMLSINKPQFFSIFFYYERKFNFTCNESKFNKCNEVKVLESKKKVTSLQVKVKFKFFTSLLVEVPESLLKYCNEVFLLR